MIFSITMRSRPHTDSISWVSGGTQAEYIIYKPLFSSISLHSYIGIEPRRSPPVPCGGLQALARDHRDRTRPCQRHSVEQVARSICMHARAFTLCPPPSSFYRGHIGPKGAPLPDAWRIDPSCADGAHGSCAHCAKDPDAQSAHRALQELPNHSVMHLSRRAGARKGRPGPPVHTLPHF